MSGPWHWAGIFGRLADDLAERGTSPNRQPPCWFRFTEFRCTDNPLVPAALPRCCQGPACLGNSEKFIPYPVWEAGSCKSRHRRQSRCCGSVGNFGVRGTGYRVGARNRHAPYGHTRHRSIAGHRRYCQGKYSTRAMTCRCERAWSAAKPDPLPNHAGSHSCYRFGILLGEGGKSVFSAGITPSRIERRALRFGAILLVIEIAEKNPMRRLRHALDLPSSAFSLCSFTDRHGKVAPFAWKRPGVRHRDSIPASRLLIGKQPCRTLTRLAGFQHSLVSPGNATPVLFPYVFA